MVDFSSLLVYTGIPHTRKVSSMTDLELGWLAGIIDGEGCISISFTGEQMNVRQGRRTPHYRLFLQILMCNEACIRKVHELTGVGTVAYRNNDRFNRHPSWCWRCGSRQAASVLNLISPLLVVKQEECNAALEFLALPATRNCKQGVPPNIQLERIRLYNLIRDLKPVNAYRNHKVTAY